MNKLKMIVPFGNDLESAIAEVVLPEAIERMRGKLAAVRNVNVDSEDVARNKGQEVEIDRPISFGDADELGSDKSGVDSDVETSKEKVVLNKYFYKQFKMDETEILGSRSDFVLPNSLAAAIDSVARSVEKHVLSAYKQIPHFSGVLSEDGDHTHKSFIAAEKSLHNTGLVEDDRVALISQNMKSDVLSTMRLDFQSDDTRASGNLGSHYGFGIAQASYAPYHTAGTAASNAGLSLEANQGEMTVQVIGLKADETIVEGDLLETASGATFSAAEDVVATGEGAQALKVYQVVDKAIAGEAVSIKGDHDVNIGLHPSAITAVFRPLEQRSTGEGFAVNMIDPVSGVPLTIRQWTENGGRTKRWAVECLMGMKYHDLGRAVRIGKA